MRKIALVGCSKKKQGSKCPEKSFKVSEIYTGNNFKKSRDFGINIFGCEKDFFVLSGNFDYGLLNCNDKICYYDKYLGKCTINEKKLWSQKVLNQLNQKFDIKNTQFVIFAGSSYSMFLKNHLNCIILKFNARNITFEIKEILNNGGK